jgi:hypothetical protein
VEIFWAGHVPPGSRTDVDDEEAFRENLVHLRRMTAHCPEPSIPDGQTTKQDGSTPAEAVMEVRLNRFERLSESPRSQSPQKANSAYLRLPDLIRFKSMKYLLASHNLHDKPIRMNAPVFLYEAWPVNRLRERKVWSTDYFDSLESILSCLEPYTSVCSAMRADVLTTLFLTSRFHVVYSPYVARELQPAATHYMDRYGPLMASITLEVDFTKLGGGWSTGAANFTPQAGLQRVQQLLERFVARQATRHGTGIKDLRILVRRYHGHRPPPASPKPTKHRRKKARKSAINTPSPSTTTQLNSPGYEPKHKPTPYTPDALVSSTLTPLTFLGPLVETLTITGAPASFASELITSLCANSSSSSSKAHLSSDTDQTDQLEQHITYRYPAREYPLLPGQTAVVDYGPGRSEAHVPAGGEGGHLDGDGVQLVTCESSGETGGWDGGGYGCQLLASADMEGRGGGKGADGGNGKGRMGLLKREREGKRRVVRRLSKGVQGVLALRGKEKDGKGAEGKEGGKKVEDEEDVVRGIEVENAAENTEVQRGQRKGRIINAGRKGLFGHY